MVKRFVFWGMLCHHRGLDTQEFISKLIRFRYIFKVYSDDDTTYVMLGSENQPAIHYAMPLRNMIYDALSLLARVRMKQAEHLQNNDLQDAGEFLSRFSRTDRIDPVVTLVIYDGLNPH